MGGGGRVGGGAGGGSSGGGGGGTGGGAGELSCPSSLAATLVGPAAGACSVGDVLTVTLVRTPPPGRAVCVHPGTGATVGALAGIPGLAKLIQCLEANVPYEAHVTAKSGGRVDVTVLKV